MSEIASRVKAIIVEKLGVEDSEVTSEASFTNDLGADSLDTVELIMEFEKEFGISIPDDQDVSKCFTQSSTFDFWQTTRLNSVFSSIIFSEPRKVLPSPISR